MSLKPAGQTATGLINLFAGGGPAFADRSNRQEYGRIKAELARAGTPIPENDVWIAAQAIEQGLPLATCDAHFGRINRLVVLDWS
ncbi:MAG: hypothetical protein LV481_07410 [Methylacidiphilales bacterium]|nr:hypothetical protein [Candidatus Methylacidiphilales bacterium]